MFKEYSKIMGYTVLTIIVLSVVGAGLRFAGVFGERIVFENSFQYKKGMESRALVLQAQIAEVDRQITINPDMAQQLSAQKKVLQIQLQATQL